MGSKDNSKNTLGEFPSKYNSQEIEREMRSNWATSDVYQWKQELPEELDFVIDTPPPTVSGTLHIGHVYSYTQADIIARYTRMKGMNVLYPIGWDDNGLPTERLVEKVKKVKGGFVDKEEYKAMCAEVIPEYEAQFKDLFTTLGLSVDWNRKYQTVSSETTAISQMSFLDLFDKGLVEQRLEPVIWDPKDRTAIAQAEVDEIEREGTLNYITFKLDDNSLPPIQIATTRPELLGGCSAIMIHPDHPRADELLHRKAITPLFGVSVPFIKDNGVDPEKGTGLVMCCTFGDATDIQWYKTHQLPLRLVINEVGKMIEDTGIGNGGFESIDLEKAKSITSQLANLKVAEARKVVIDILKDSGELYKQEKTKQIIPVAERSGAPLEIIVTPQWFIKIVDFKDQILEKSREIKFHPEHMRTRLENWIENTKWDWCISRQRYLGIPIPAWTSKREGEQGKILVATKEQLPIDPAKDLPNGYTADEVEPMTDVMDTWATSSLTPQLVTKSINKNYAHDFELHRRLSPAALRPQAHEIIRTWAFYTIVKALHHNNTIPWTDVTISGWCLAKDGSKMSKSKGNTIDPVKMLSEHGTDAVRYWTGTSKLGHDTLMSPTVLKQGRRLATKLWNASRLAHMAIGDSQIIGKDFQDCINKAAIVHPIDVWLCRRILDTVSSSTKAMDAYEYSKALKTIETFFWNDYCDNYLELVKWRTSEDSELPSEYRTSALNTLYFATIELLRLFAPFLPYVTDKLYSIFSCSGDTAISVHEMGNWPKPLEIPSSIETPFDSQLLEITSVVRKMKSNLGVSIKKYFGMIYLDSAEDLKESDFLSILPDLSKSLKVGQLKFRKPDDIDNYIETEGSSINAWIDKEFADSLS